MRSLTRNEVRVVLRTPHDRQREFIESTAKRKVIRAGRRSGKTTGIATLAVQQFLCGRRVLYATPTAEQITRFWFECKRALQGPIDVGLFVKNETIHAIDLPGTEQRIRAKTAWNADTLRGDFADLLILDEFQLMDEEAWEVVGAPMLLDNNGDAVFIYTPPSRRSRSISRARNPRYVAKLFERAKLDDTGRWQAFHFTSHDNPYISAAALDELGQDMTALAYRQEIMAEDVEEVPGALWNHAQLEDLRVIRPPTLARIIVSVDPSGTATASSDETGIVVAGIGSCRCLGREEVHGFVLADLSGHYSPHEWGRQAVSAYWQTEADRIVAETNNGGDMVEAVLRTIDRTVAYKGVHASRGKAARAEPVAALYEQGRIHHVGHLHELEDQMCMYVPGFTTKSPDRLDALVWAFTELMLDRQREELVVR